MGKYEKLKQQSLSYNYNSNDINYGIDSLFDIELDVVVNKKVVVPAIQYDNIARRIRVAVRDSGKVLNIANSTPYFYCKKSDGKIIYNEAEIVDIENGLIDLILTEQALAVAGDQKAILLLKQDKKILQSYSFIIKVTESIYDTEAILSSNEFDVLDKALDKAISKVDGFADKLRERNYTVNVNQADWKANTTMFNGQTVYEKEIIHNAKTNNIKVEFYAKNGTGYDKHVTDTICVNNGNIKIVIDEPRTGYFAINLGLDTL